MKHLLLLFFLVLSSCVALTQSVIRVDSLPPQGILLDKGGTFHAADNPDWAKPTFNDSRWETIDPTKDIMALLAVRPAGIGWFVSIAFSHQFFGADCSRTVYSWSAQGGANQVLMKSGWDAYSGMFDGYFNSPATDPAPTFLRDKFQGSVLDKVATATFLQTRQRADGSKLVSRREVRVLEKQDNDWKLVYVHSRNIE